MLSLFNNVTELVNELGTEKTAAEKSAMDDPGGMEGPTSHPSKKPDDDEQAPTEGFQSADNERTVKESIPDTTNKKPELTEGSAPKATDVQLGQGVDAAKPTGEDPSAEEDYKSTLEGDKKQGDQGGTSHPATGAYGEKYSADKLAEMDDETLCKAAKDLGDDVLADIANGLWSDAPAAAASDANVAARAGEKIAADAGTVDNSLEQVASGVVQSIVKQAYHQADLTAAQIHFEMEKQGMEGEGEDPTGGAAEGEDHGSDPTRKPPEEGEEVPPEEGTEEGAEGLLAAMGGGGAEEALGGEGLPPEGPPPEAGPEMGGLGAELGGMGGGEMGPEMGGGMPPEMGGGMGPEMGGGMPPEMGGEMGGMGGPPPEMAGMPDEAVIQQLAMALMEAGIDPQMLAAAGQATGSPEATKIAAAVHEHKKSGNFCFEEAKQGSDERKARDYMKGFVTELYRRSQK